MHSYDEIFSIIGGFGRYQKLLTVFMAWSSALFGIQNLMFNLIAYEPPHWCKIDNLQHLSYEEQKHLAIPWDSEEEEYSSCKMYDLAWENYTQDELKNLTVPDGTPTVECSQWIFNKEGFEETAVTEVCFYNLQFPFFFFLPLFFFLLTFFFFFFF